MLLGIAALRALPFFLSFWSYTGLLLTNPNGTANFHFKALYLLPPEGRKRPNTEPVSRCHNRAMPHIDYPPVITESPAQLHQLEKRHRYTHLFQRVRMLRLLKSGECSNLGEAADALGYSRRQCQRWWSAYTEGGLDELLVSRVDERGAQELVSEEAWEELEEAMKKGSIATYEHARAFLAERGIEYASADSVGGLFRRRKAKLKTGPDRGMRKPTPKSRRLSKKVCREAHLRE